jgi:hypothetical protein
MHIKRGGDCNWPTASVKAETARHPVMRRGWLVDGAQDGVGRFRTLGTDSAGSVKDVGESLEGLKTLSSPTPHPAATRRRPPLLKSHAPLPSLLDSHTGSGLQWQKKRKGNQSLTRFSPACLPFSSSYRTRGFAPFPLERLGTRSGCLLLPSATNITDMRRDVQEIFRATPNQKQVMMFSATLAKEVRVTCKKFMQSVSVD